MFFDKELCLFQIQVNNQQSLFEKMAGVLEEAGCVKDTYLKGILSREAEFPTGIEVNGVGFALPHTDSIHVKQSQICFASLKEPIVFSSMVDKEDTFPVQLVFMLAMATPHEQVETLQNLVELFQDDEKVQQLLSCSEQEEFMDLLHAAAIK